ncbi:Lipid A 3-O-deacylase (PagL) [Rhodoblastus acidophilus]|uniref:Lipid A 3-O-deacylase (PagL) n=1 Tax=Rhodoblastus acidophilus TaxID=1074 RepID=A0A212RZZ5_RHOAC|nr:acyloxyacyl hydrolase [Rhodoblastus acidophilus]SNB78477.1 Lipid A 3-O-deacylase (PagL) [Rhodoblastus acidophilus]
MKRHVCLIVLSSLCGAPAMAGDTSPFGELLPPEATYRLHAPFEARIGGFAHEPGGAESGSTDVSAEIVFGDIIKTTNPWWSFVAMRADIGGTFNTANKTNGIYFGPLWTVALTDRIFIEGSVGGAWNDGVTNGVRPPQRAGVGCHWGFHESASLGYNLTEHWSVMATVEHYSNLNLCHANHGVTNYGARIGYSF